MVHLATLLVVATIATCAASPVQVDNEWGWNQLLFADDLFDQPTNAIQSKGNDKALVVDELTTLLADKELLAQLYNKYATKFGKEIEMSRMEIFKEKLIGFASNNLDTLAKGDGPHLGITQFTDLTYEEFIADYAEPLGSMGVNDNSSTFTQYQSKNPGTPDSVDWRTSGKVSKVKWQNKCGTCALFSTVAAIETAQAIARNSNGAQDLSTQAILDCGDFIPETICSKGGPGTDPRDSANYVRKNGLPGWGDYPYVGEANSKGTCKKDLPMRATLKGYNTIPEGDEVGIQNAAAVGPVVVMVYVPKLFQDYREGVFDLADCKAKSNGLHAITVVGYTPDYFIIKNSWDTWWGIKGYVNLKKGTSCWGGYSTTVQSCKDC